MSSNDDVITISSREKATISSEKKRKSWISNDEVSSDVSNQKRATVQPAVVSSDVSNQKRATVHQQLVLKDSDSKTMSFGLMDTTVFCLRAKDSADALCDRNNQRLMLLCDGNNQQGATVHQQMLFEVSDSKTMSLDKLIRQRFAFEIKIQQMVLR
ncbi:hypothetical protein F511_16348 [Dorcoceras hygrometricum]|uniref:Uncharacterized protein n=1 Tax=Dorcoceras hygrometricum TaxID=472368 RepID=A0A2Z7BR35_9LAMI|nr:hypothetical protein F511_16348 [Dorcoceras hygrometricum]